MVLKPGDGVASGDVVRVSGPAEVELRCAELFARHPDRELLAEEFLPGTLQTVETLGDGVTRWVLGGFRTTVSPPYFAEERLTWDPPGAAADGHVSAALDALGVSFGACHTEYVSGPAVRLIEVNDRLIGDHCDFLLAHVLGLPLFELVLRVHLGERLPPVMPAAPPGRTHAIADYVIAERRGVLAVVPPAARHDVVCPGVTLAHWPLREPGEHVTVTGSNRDYLGVISAVGPDEAKCRGRCMPATRSAALGDPAMGLARARDPCPAQDPYRRVQVRAARGGHASGGCNIGDASANNSS